MLEPEAGALAWRGARCMQERWERGHIARCDKRIADGVAVWGSRYTHA